MERIKLRLAPIPGRLLTWPPGGVYDLTIAGGKPSTNDPFEFLTTENRPPVFTGLSTIPAVEGNVFVVAATFTDSDSSTPVRDLTINWGDGTTTTLTVTLTNGAGPVSAEHVYANGGFYDATVRIADAADATVFTTRPFTAIITGAGIQNGVLQIVGTDGSDQVTITPGLDGQIQVGASFLPGGTKRFTSSGVASILLRLFANDDDTTLNLIPGGSSSSPPMIHLDSGGAGSTFKLLVSDTDVVARGVQQATVNGEVTITWAASLQTVVVTTTPQVTSLLRLGYHAHPTRLLVGFNEPMDKSRAEDVSNYRLVSLGPDGLLGTRDDRVIRIKRVAYDPASHVLIISPSHRLPLRMLYRLTINGTSPNGLTNTSGVFLDGAVQGCRVPVTCPRSEPTSSHSQGPRRTSRRRPRSSRVTRSYDCGRTNARPGKPTRKRSGNVDWSGWRHATSSRPN